MDRPHRPTSSTLLKKSGWKEGTGLSTQEQGRLVPVETHIKNNKCGLGSKEPKPKPKVEDGIEKYPQKPKYIMCLSTRNDCVDKINMRMIGRFRGEETVYHSFDRAEDDPHNYYPPEFLNSFTPNGLPPHVIRLKINRLVILLRNIDPANGLCNGTRLIVRGFQKNTIDAEIVLGQHAGKRVFLLRIPLCSSDDEMFPFRFKRKQFSIRLSFAMTINKAQGQTIPHVGVYIPKPVFSHGQLYVATAGGNIKVLAGIDKGKRKKNSKQDQAEKLPKQSGTYTRNIVYKEVLTP
ncbi:hypothetical protein U9M48_001106 [Paspalum notatum var. saurae]|uniref:G-patch domain-containing protein n=1 Tax=Paspalum notatum var. saurae TaxID=547442 RepID=A0AAQ3PMZ5_PASNO